MSKIRVSPMHGFYTEYRSLPSSVSLSRDIAQHIFVRGVSGGVGVVTERPHDLASITKKQWHVLIRLVERERASTLKAARIAELSNQIEWMQQLPFIISPSEKLPANAVVFAQLSYFMQNPPICSTLYMTTSFEPNHIKDLARRSQNGVVVIYRS